MVLFGTFLLVLHHSQCSCAVDSNGSVTVLLQWYFLVLFLLVLCCSECSYAVDSNGSVTVLLQWLYLVIFF